MKFSLLILVKCKCAVSVWTRLRYFSTRSSNLTIDCLHLLAGADAPEAGIWKSLELTLAVCYRPGEAQCPYS
ncbi:hypothetical protein QTJ16_003978 [Diplocarpon rosae]|uniref:Uncharacterized protein n=1 Tax=Diplocarpon rosae TaxID=946125 RepID=A0AAD9T0X3_9HELO|nr:hypothetical protein QTJ16_003978 [Diplocarpon rosae]